MSESEQNRRINLQNKLLMKQKAGQELAGKVRTALNKGGAESLHAGKHVAVKVKKAVGIDEKTSLLSKVIRLGIFMFVVGMIGMVVSISAIYVYFGSNLPAHEKLRDYQPKISTRVHAGDGKLLAEFAVERRVFLPIAAIPDNVKQAFISAEDKNFYTHHGLDFFGIVRAIFSNINNVIQGSGNLVGASTITQQVAKNFLLTNEKTFTRKFKEAIITFRIEGALTKDRILELYLNEIYLGNRSYGVAAAAQDYFGKALEDVNIAEAASLAALPKAPSNYNPKRYPERALQRRNWVIGRMHSNGYISESERDHALAMDLVVPEKIERNRAYASYFVEEVRRTLIADLGKAQLYGGGLTIRTTLDSVLQKYAEEALFKGLRIYDRRHGYRGPLGHLPIDTAHSLDFLERYQIPAGAPSHWRVALVTKVEKRVASLAFQDQTQGDLLFQPLRWARRYLLPKFREQGKKKTDQELLEAAGVIDERSLSRRTRPLGAYISDMAQVVSVGDVILVSSLEDKKGAKENGYELEQIPQADGGILVMDVHTGRVLAMVGGWSFQRSQYNRVTQASRQPGSAFKPFVYLSALERGFTPATRILDAPFVLDLGNGTKWKPSNYSRRYYGASPMRVGIEQSRNLMTVRLAQALGMQHIREIAQRFNITEEMSLHLPNALGSDQTTLIQLTTAYAMLANGGTHLEATLIDRLQDRYGKTLVRHDKRICTGCNIEGPYQKGLVDLPILLDNRIQITDPASAYQITSMMEGVVKRGTGRQVSRKFPSKVFAGKTGTTNDGVDSWFIGFTPNLITGVFIGHDLPRSLGMYNDSVQEAGSTIAVPIFVDFMEKALQNRSTVPFRVPPAVQLVRINPKTGALSRSGDRSSLLEAFKPGTQPQSYRTASLLIGDIAGNLPATGQDDDPLQNSSSTTDNSFETDGIEQEEDEIQGIY